MPLTEKETEQLSQITEILKARGIDLYPKTKKFWIEIIKNSQNTFEVKNDQFDDPNWEQAIKDISSLKELDELGRKLRREVYDKRKKILTLYTGILYGYEEGELKEIINQDFTNLKKELDYRLEDLGKEEELVNIKDRKIDNLEDEVKKWKTKYYQERKRFIYHDIQLAKELKKNDNLNKKYKGLLKIWVEKVDSNLRLSNQYGKLREKKEKSDTRLRKARENQRQLTKSKEEALEELKVEKDDIIIKLERELAISKK